ncbi:MAG: hypothetical protein M3Q22_01620 [Actinomycetota bacterium]|nr:hypothetical protein [Actinomycetota bacterium]
MAAVPRNAGTSGSTGGGEVGVPDFAYGFRFLGHTDQGGRGDGVQVIVHDGHAYVGHMFSGGVTILDVRDPRDPHAVGFLPAAPGTWNLHLQVADGLLLVVDAVDLFAVPAFSDEANYYGRSVGEVLAEHPPAEYAAGMRVYDLADPASPRRIGSLTVDGFGLHRIWYVGGRWAYASALLHGFTDYVLVTIDMADPARPRLAGTSWLPGMHLARGERPAWPAQHRYALHHAIVAGDRAYGCWRDGGLTVHDVADPTGPELLVHRNWCPPFGGGTHTALPLPGRDLLVVADEGIADNCADQVKYTWVFDIRVPTNPVSISTFPTPAETDYCAKGGHFGPHNVHENRPGSFVSEELVFATYQNAGVRAFDLADPFFPREVAAFVPPAPARMFDSRPDRPRVIQSCDVFVDAEGVVYVTDYNAGLCILQYEGGS